jgi:hypothetical protein
MSALAKLHALLPWAIFSPFIVVVVAVIATQLIKRGRWIVHILAFVAMVLLMPVYLHIQAVLDPTSIDYPGPGDGFGLLLWLYCLVPSIIFYAGYACVTWLLKPGFTPS